MSNLQRLAAITVILCPLVWAAGHPAPVISVPVGTPIRLQLETEITSQRSHAGDVFSGRVMQTVLVDNQTAIPAGARIAGHVAHVRDLHAFQGRSELLLRPDDLVLPDGRQYTLSADVLQTDPSTGTTVDAEGMVQASRRPGRRDAVRTGAAGVGGALLGAAMLGGKAIAVGGVAGLVAGGGWWLLRPHHADLTVGSEMVVRLERPLELAATGMPPAALPLPAPVASPIVSAPDASSH